MARLHQRLGQLSPANDADFVGQKRPVRTAAVFDELRWRIVCGKLRVGDRIIEQDIAQQLSVSRGPVRDALHKLEQEGLVVARPYAGVRVAEISRDEIEEICELRRQVEYFAVAGAALRAPPETIEELRIITRGMRSAFVARDAKTLLELDLAFHLGICKASGHPTLESVMHSLLPKLAVIFYPQMLVGNTPRSFEMHHSVLLDQITARDLGGALSSIDAHIGRFYRDLQIRLGPASAPTVAFLERYDPARPMLVERRRGRNSGDSHPSQEGMTRT